jgi:hypothetical protein
MNDPFNERPPTATNKPHHNETSSNDFANYPNEGPAALQAVFFILSINSTGVQ